jgi:hypothetical protein
VQCWGPFRDPQRGLHHLLHSSCTMLHHAVWALHSSLRALHTTLHAPLHRLHYWATYTPIALSSTASRSTSFCFAS